MQYTTHRRSKKDFWKSRNTKFYLAVFFVFVAIVAGIAVAVRQKSSSNSDNDNNEILDNTTSESGSEEVTVPIKAGKYEISINLNNCMISVIDKDMDRVIRMMPAAISNTIENGTYEPQEESECRFTWKADGDTGYYRYYTSFGNDIVFHSSRYKEQHNKNSLVTEDYNSIGTISETEGVTLTVEDAKWIYENCSSDSYITVISMESHIKPGVIKIPDNMTWDPTEVSKESPWCQSEIKSLDCSDIIEIKSGDSENLIRNHIKAIDEKDVDISSYVKLLGDYNTDIPGTYDITLQIADIHGNVLTKNVSLVVIEPETEPATEDETESESESETETEDETMDITEESSESEKEAESESETELEEPTTESLPVDSEEDTSIDDENAPNITEEITQPESESPADIF